MGRIRSPWDVRLPEEMAAFRILACFVIESTRARFDVELLSGDVSIGEQFVVFDTYHHVPFIVEAVERSGTRCLLSCRGSLGADQMFTGCVVNTEGVARLETFHYPRPPLG